MTLSRISGAPWQVEVAIYKNTGGAAYTCVFRSQEYSTADEVWTAFKSGLQRAMKAFEEKYGAMEPEKASAKRAKATGIPNVLEALAGGEIKADVIK